MPEKFVWDESYSVGDAEIDIQHKGLFSLVNSLQGNLDVGQIQVVLRLLKKYTINHFAVEEKFMMTIAYPQINEHKMRHNELVVKLKSLNEKDYTDPASILSLRAFMAEWLTKHILQEDLQFAAFNKKEEPEPDDTEDDAGPALELL